MNSHVICLDITIPVELVTQQSFLSCMDVIYIIDMKHHDLTIDICLNIQSCLLLHFNYLTQSGVSFQFECDLDIDMKHHDLWVDFDKFILPLKFLRFLFCVSLKIHNCIGNVTNYGKFVKIGPKCQMTRIFKKCEMTQIFKKCEMTLCLYQVWMKLSKWTCAHRKVLLALGDDPLSLSLWPSGKKSIYSRSSGLVEYPESKFVTSLVIKWVVILKKNKSDLAFGGGVQIS